MTGMTRMTRMTLLQGSYTVLIKKIPRTFQGQISHSSRIPIIALSICLFYFFHNMTANLIFYPEGLSVFAPFRHLRIWV